jgi:hypothetical protein
VPPRRSHYDKSALSLAELVALYRMVQFCIVNSLSDGMNLIARVFVAARDDEDGVLLLSEIPGAAEGLRKRSSSIRTMSMGLSQLSRAPCAELSPAETFSAGQQTFWKVSKASGRNPAVCLRRLRKTHTSDEANACVAVCFEREAVTEIQSGWLRPQQEGI